MLRPLYLFIFKLIGWKVEGSFAPNLKKYIVAVAPHTSNWDFVIGIMARSITHLQRAKFLGKSQLFKAPYGWFFRLLGGYPVDRSSSHDMVQQVVNLFNEHDEFVLAIAPEGTRKKVERLKTGFYFIAKAAHVPIIPVGFDFLKKKVIIGIPVYPSDTIEKDMETLMNFYRAITGRNPSLGIQ
ncbi:MAG: Acyltransferase [Cytophagales bacterium]|jgi:1-acyl-sn-glycerol-3-phosphate acyltransferase|nr:lysophospholipid acyltransferase family protein [Bacteroidota bacterium]MBS1982007.1 lysophospholipid acyltransferase family protein [Bacteroidota bacterium]WHZ09461.1 MAG: Acyltransferase [Cytophagales bacterium]